MFGDILDRRATSGGDSFKVVLTNSGPSRSLHALIPGQPIYRVPVFEAW